MLRMEMPYQGADWVARGPFKGKTMSPLGVIVADVVGLVWRGIYHLPSHAVRSVDWSDTHRIRIAVPADLCTYDGNELTKLVVVCHDALLRLEVDPAGPRRLSLAFFQRAGRTGALHARMPTLENHVAAIRSEYTLTEDHADEPQQERPGSEAT